VSQQTTNRTFDELASGLASGSISRGRALKLMGAALVGGTLASLGIGEAAAEAGGCKRTGKACKENSQCCSRNCANGTCAEPVPLVDFSCLCNDNSSQRGCLPTGCLDLDTVCEQLCANHGGHSGAGNCGFC
jgi:hypothetical protein